VFTIVALIAVVVVVAQLLRKARFGGRRDLGVVSERWLAEYRVDASRPSR